MKLISNIVDKNFAIIGFEIEGTEKEFGGITTNKIIRTVTVIDMMNKSFRNSQVDCRGGKIKEVNNFKTKSLPIKMLNGNNLVAVDNKITLLKRLLVNGKLEGFEIEICGKPRRFRTKDIISLSRLFVGENYIVKTKETNGKVTKYLSGKAGCSLSTLPEVELGNKKETNKKARTRTATNKDDIKTNPELPDEYDIISLFEEVSDLNGLIIEFPDKVYESASVQDVIEAPQFKKLGIGSIGNPYIKPSRDGMNINCTFRIPGNVAVEFNGGKLPITTFITRTHHVFKDGEVYDGDLGLVVSEDKIESLKNKFAASLGLTEVTDDKVVTPIRSIYDNNTLRAFRVDTRRLSIMSKARAEKSLLDEKQIRDIVNNLIDIDTRYKYFNAKVKQAKDAMAQTGQPLNRPKYGMFAGMNDAMIDACVAAGIDVFTGGFIETVENPKALQKEAFDVQSKINGEYKKVEPYSVKFVLKGFASIPSAKDIENKTSKASKFISKELSDQIDAVSQIASVDKIYDVCEEQRKKVEAAKNKLTEKLFYHNIACLVLGDYKGYKMDKSHWEYTGKTGVYKCSLPGLEDLQMTIKGGIDLI